MIYHSKTSPKKGRMAIIISEKYILKQRIFSWIKIKRLFIILKQWQHQEDTIPNMYLCNKRAAKNM